ncbi:MAG: S8 family serine peptidase, partial [Bdellovibrionales bacterium]
TEAVKNLAHAGTVIVASAGNSGPVDYIVGAPSTSNEAISVAASIDGSPHNWQFAAVRFTSPDGSNWIAKAIEGAISKPIKEVDSAEGELVDIGLADADLPDPVKARLQGKVALIVRGKVPFLDKLKRASEAGAVGAVVYNSEPGKPIPMGGDGKVDIPAIMISQALGLKLKSELTQGPVHIQFKTGEVIEEPELIDTITEFSSKGPRSEDNLLKPEVAAPGQQVISAAMGEGDDSVALNGTSMAAPHLTGVVALLKQRHPKLGPEDFKSLVMNTAKVLSTPQGQIPISLQGAGRVRIAEALDAPLVVSPQGLSLGRVQLRGQQRTSRTVRLRNISDEPLALTTNTQTTPGLRLGVPASIHLAAGEEVEVSIRISYALEERDQFQTELNGRILFMQGERIVAQIPALAIRTQSSEIRSVEASTRAGSIQLTNASAVNGLALAFNLIGEDARKPEARPTQQWRSRSCDLQSAGYRILRKQNQGDSQGPKEVIQFAFKLFTPVTTWHLCEVSVLIDGDGDDVADQELAGVAGLSAETPESAVFASVLLDAKKAREIRLAYEKEINEGREGSLNYETALIHQGGMAPFTQSTIALIETPVEKLLRAEDGRIRIKLASVGGNENMIESDDYLGEGLGEWTFIPGTLTEQPYFGMPEAPVVSAQGASLNFEKGTGEGKLVLYYPFNPLMRSGADGDAQSEILDEVH